MRGVYLPLPEFSNEGKNYALQRGVYGQYYTGQLGKAVVGGTWKDKKTLRTYVIPPNPNTASQQTVRGKFKLSQVFASRLLLTICQPYWNPFADGQSGFNKFIGHNSLVVSSNVDFVGVQTIFGSYEGLEEVLTATYNTGTGEILFTFPTAVLNIGNASDEIIVVAVSTEDYNPTAKKPILQTWMEKTIIRSAGSGSIDIVTGKDPAGIFVYLATKQPVADQVLKLGTSKSLVCSAP